MNLSWLNAPPHWREDGNTLHVTTGDRTDFWCRTHYGFVRDNGHFRHVETAGDFTASVTVDAAYTQLYDQAGLMVRVDAGNWLKTGIEFTDGAAHFSTVVTRDGYSDWSQFRLPEDGGHGAGGSHHPPRRSLAGAIPLCPVARGPPPASPCWRWAKALPWA